jgi:hypothetical protein
MPHEYEYPNLATRLRSQASSCHCKHTCIIENANGVPPAWWYGSFPISKWQDKQTMNTLTSLLFTIGYSFLFWDASSNVHYGYALNFHHEWCMVYISGPGVSLTYIQTPWAHKFPTYFTSLGIHKQKIMISTK